MSIVSKLYFPTKTTEHDKYFIYLEVYKLEPITIEIDKDAKIIQQAASFFEEYSLDTIYDYKNREMEFLEVMRLPLQQSMTETVSGSYEPVESRKLQRMSELASNVLNGGGGDSLLKAGKNYLMDSLLAGEIGDEFGVGQALGAAGGSAMGKAINPNEQLTYKGPSRRDWPFEMTLIARSLEDAKIMQKIRKRLQYHASPGLDPDGYWEYPHFFRFKFEKYDHATNSWSDIQNLFYSKFCFMENVSIKSGNERYDEYSDGRGSSFPGYMQISFSLKDTNFTNKADYEEDSTFLTGNSWEK